MTWSKLFFSNFKVHRNYISILLNADPDSVGPAWDYAFLTRFQEMPVLLFHSLHLRDQRYRIENFLEAKA